MRRAPHSGRRASSCYGPGSSGKSDGGRRPRPVEAERRREAARAEKARRHRLDLLRTRGDAVWAEIETEIERRNGPGYDQAARLITDMATLAEETDQFEDFSRWLDDIRERHARKARFLEWVADL